MINFHRLMRASGGGSREHGGVVDCCCDDPRTHPPAAQSKSQDGSLACVYPGGGEDHLIRSCPYGGGYHFARLVQGLGGKASRPVEPDRISPTCLLRTKPSLARIGEHRLARRAVQEDLRNRMRHVSKLAREPPCRALACHTANPQKRDPYTGDDSVFLG
jgi:hypothetical protein